METKRCTKCGEIKPVSDFHTQRNHKDGHASSCKSCKNKRHREWVAANIEKSREYHKHYMSGYRESEKQIEYRTGYRERNKEKIKKQCKDYIIRHKAVFDNYKKEYRKQYWAELQASHYFNRKGFKKKDIPTELIELKICQLKLMRETKTAKGENVEG